MDLTVEEEDDDGLAIKLQTGFVEVNVHGLVADFLQLDGIREARWEDRMTLQVGQSAEAKVYWSFDGEAAFLAIGADDEMWDIGLAVPLAVVDEIVIAARATMRSCGLKCIPTERGPPR